MRLARTDTSPLSQWWWTVDRVSLAAMGLLFAAGVLLAFAAGPAAAGRIGQNLSDFHFVKRQVMFLGPAVGLSFAVSLLSPLYVRRLAVLVFGGSLVAMGLTLMIGPEIKGAQRWLYFGGVSLQPSEFAKPAFIVVTAWMFAEQIRDPKFPGRIIAVLFYLVIAGLLIKQPDYGQWVLTTAAWASVFFIAGVSWPWIVALGGFVIAASLGAYILAPHVASRVDAFLNPATEGFSQTDIALKAIARGGVSGRGPGEGDVKHALPDAHTDFIFAVAGEEFGLIACLLLVSLFAIIVLRAYARAFSDKSPFVQLAASGLAALIGLQALINMAVNLRLMPAKGMTLPLVSYGGSSMLATALALGMLLALTRERPHTWRRKEAMV
ncbi:MAG: putative peptidoglycan glycosyltransferase FtsW [Pseudomonadota bacterium]